MLWTGRGASESAPRKSSDEAGAISKIVPGGSKIALKVDFGKGYEKEENWYSPGGQKRAKIHNLAYNSELRNAPEAVLEHV